MFRATFLAFMTWLLVVFLPGHTRGQITLRGAGGDACCAPVAPKADSCCTSAGDDAPTDTDRANCAVCWWAAGLLTTPPFVLDTSHAERAYEHARHYHAQVRREASRLTHFGRDPPMSLA